MTKLHSNQGTRRRQMNRWQHIQTQRKHVLGRGMYGTTYLVKDHTNQSYALKIEHIASQAKTRSYKHGIWRELDFYQFVNRLNLSDSRFFTKSIQHHIVDSCTHVQQRPKNIETLLSTDSSSWANEIRAIDASTYCYENLIEYKGNQTLSKYITQQRSSFTKAKILSICLQICKMGEILMKGKYIHGDLKTNNIMVQPCKPNQTFVVFHHRCSHQGIQLSAIDYGEAQHAKYIQYMAYSPAYRKLFTKQYTTLLFLDIFHICVNQLLLQQDMYMGDCQRQKKNYYPMIITLSGIHVIYINCLHNMSTIQIPCFVHVYKFLYPQPVYPSLSNKKS